MPGIAEQKSEDVKPKDQQPVESVFANVEISVHQETPTTPPATSSLLHASVSTTLMALGSVDNLHIASNLLSGPSSPSNLSSVTLIGSTGSGSSPQCHDKDLTPTDDGPRVFKYSQAPTSPLPERKRKPPPIDAVAVITSTDAEIRNDENTATNNQMCDKQEHGPEKVASRPTESTSSKPKIISAIAKSVHAELLGRRNSKVDNVLKPAMDYLTMNRRPSTGTMGIPMAALSQHRRSLQLNTPAFDTFGVSGIDSKGNCCT